MPGMLLHVGALIQCTHAAPVTVISSNTRVLLNGMPAATLADTFLVAGCPFIVGLVPQPCLRLQWVVPATRVLINGQPALLNTSTGLCLGPTQAPQGAPIVSVVQSRVTGT